MTSGLVLSSSWQQTSRYFFTSAMYNDHASFGCSVTCSTFGLATMPVFKIRPPLRLPTISGGGATGFSSRTDVVGLSGTGICSCIFLNISIKLPSFLNALGGGKLAMENDDDDDSWLSSIDSHSYCDVLCCLLRLSRNFCLSRLLLRLRLRRCLSRDRSNFI